MKKLLLLSVLLFTTMVARATITFTMDNVELKPSEQKQVAVNVTNDVDLPGFEMKIFLPEGISFQGTTKAKRVKATDRLDGFSITGANQSDGSYKIQVVNLDGESIPAGEGAVIYLLIQADEDAVLGDKELKLGTVRYSLNNVLQNHSDVVSTVSIYKEFTINANSANEEMGGVTGGGTFRNGSTISLTATPNEGYHFVGWSDDTDTNPYSIVVDANLDLTASFAPNQYAMTFVLANGEADVVKTLDYKSELTAPEAPARTGYTFGGWNPEVPQTVPLGDKTFTAQWTVNQYTISYDLAGGAVATENPTSYTIEGEAITLTNPTREGYTFAGWTGTELTEATTAVTIAKGSIGDREYTATWTPITYTMGYELAGGAVATENPTSYTIESEAITLTNPTREGYDFAGWTGTDLTEATVDVTIAKGSIGDRSYTATWTPITYTISYDLAGGAVATPNAEEYTIESDAITLTNPTREGYTFAGWTGTELTAATAAVTIAKGSIGNRSYTATWTPITYTISYELAGGAVATENPTSYTIESEAITLTNPTRTGYEFAGWTGTDLTAATTTLTIAKGSIGNRTYTATWTPVNYTISYDLAGGTVATENPTSYTIESEAITLTNPTREGYTFAGWTGTELTAATAAVTIAKGSIGNRSYTATWTPITYTISYELAGGAVATENPTSYTIESEAITLTNPTRTGYEFAGWTGTDLTAATTTLTIAKGSIGNRSYTATWTPITYTISYDLAGGAVATENPTSYTIESEAITLTNPTRTGYTFAGWTGTDLTAATAAVTIAKGSIGTRTYTATWTINQYTITFNTDGGSAVDAITQDYNTAVTAPAAPTKTGYTFAGWSPAVPQTMPAENITVTAQWTINQYTITFNTDGGSAIDAITQDYNTAVTAPAAPTKTGYTFAGWDKEIPATMPAENITVTAQWTINQYTITFNTDGGSAIAAITQDYNTAVTAPAAPTKTGYTFAGWSPAVPQTMPAENITVTAQWTINQYTIMFNTDGGSAIDAITQDYNTAVTAPAAPTKTGYTFAGWDKEIPAIMPAENITVTAQWTINQYTITFNTDGGSAIAAITQDYNTAVTAPAAPTKEGYTFTGWSPAVPQTMPAENVTVTAQWQINQYTMTFVLDNGEQNIVLTQDYATTLTAPEPTRTGFTFAGWTPEVPATIPAENKTFTAQWTRNSYTMTFVVDGQTVKEETLAFEAAITAPADPTKEGYTFMGWSPAVPQTMPAENVTVTAQWQINQYTMTFVLDNGEQNIVLTQDYATTLTAPEPTRTGFTFAGWTPEVPATIPAENKTFTAQWTRNSYTMTFVVDGQTVKEETIAFEAAITAPADPTKEGYTFMGWSPAVPQTMPAENVTVTAQWQINQYTMTFVLDNGEQNIVLTQDYATTLTAPEPTRTGFTFAGWTPEVPATIPAENKTFTAQWTRNSYTMTFVVDGQTVKEETIAFEAAVTAPADPTKEGYTFTGWSPAVPETMPAENVTVTAQWTVNQYAIIYMVGDTEWARDIVDYGSTINLRSYDAGQGYTFNGWISTDGNEYTTMPAHDITYTPSITSGIERILMGSGKTHVDVYDVNGRLVGRNMPVAKLQKQLPAGVYIIGGKKIVVK